MRKLFLLLAIFVALSATFTASASGPNVLINVTNAKISKYADGASTGASGWSLILGYVAIHSWELSQKPFGTYLYLDQPTSIGIKGSDGQVRSYSSFRVADLGDPGNWGGNDWFDIWVGRWKTGTGRPAGTTFQPCVCDGFTNGVCIASNVTNSCTEAENWSQTGVGYHYNR